MSYEGYEIWLCENNHIITYDCYMTPNKDTWKCPICEGKHKKDVSVDETNGLPYYVNFKIIKLTDYVYDECKCCGNKKLLEHPTYDIIDVDIYESEDGIFIS